MPKKMAVVNYNKCQPAQCDSGVCAAALACPHRLLTQEKVYEVPLPDPSICRGCGKCVLVCPLKAMELM